MDLGVIGGPQGPKVLLDAVRLAVRDGNLEVLSRLSKEFLAVNDNVEKCRDENGNTIVHLALDKSSSTLEYTIEALHANVNATNAQGRTPLHEAVTQGYVACCQTLLDHGADDTIQSTTQSTPFHTAAACGSVECMEVILRHSDKPEAKVNELDRQRSSALHKCAFDGDVRVSRWLVEHGASVDVADSTDATPLLIAVKMGQTDVVEYLLSKGADCNRQDRQGNSGLHFCAVRCDVKVARLLLAAGANPRLLNEEYNSPLHIVAQNARPDSGTWEEMVGVLLMAGCDPLQVNASNKKPNDYVSRGLKKIFTKEDVERRLRREAQLREESDAELARAWEQCAQWKTKVLENISVRRAWEAAEDERLAREKEERIRAANDARMMYEEALERCHFHEAEVQRKKAMLEKANAKAGR
ncbi:Ankyrin repeats (3 copies)/Ankyrin repeat/Ankyrin repeats (many copies) [Novymonas esmeraldas]|uniref:Ankyrin repeats (3 copies)/Ankyrin repeat/Ankyrin repeats (Many copies) n=1 Tax=Novymonas esmeraldas TaxID=1808958 RepID=A0AAW0EMN3_9TRYP